MPEHRSMLAVVAAAAGLGSADQPSQPNRDQAAEPSQPAERRSSVVDTGERFSMVSGRCKPVSGAEHVEQLRAKGVVVSADDAKAIDDYAATWNRSSDVRREFIRFENFEAYMRAKAAGRAKIFGQP